MVSIKLHGEANEMTDEAAANVMKGWLTEFHKTIEELGVPTDHIYNAKQTGLYYTKLQNHVYISKANWNHTKGCKLMKSKDCITVMLCTAASGLKVPLAVIRKSKQPGAAFKYELPQGRGPQLDTKTKMKHALIKTSLFGGSIKYFGHGM
jgi:hypothetical protein